MIRGARKAQRKLAVFGQRYVCVSMCIDPFHESGENQWSGEVLTHFNKAN